MSADGDGSETVIPIRKPIVIPPPEEDKRPAHRYLHWTALDGIEPPRFDWLLDHWLSWHPTFLAGRGGIGKSLLVQQLGTQLACGLPTWCAATAPIKVLYWACEDDHDQLWRRQDTICKALGIGFATLDNFKVDARYGLENTLLTTEYGRPMYTPALQTLREQVNDCATDVLLLDNIGHTFGANENVRHDVTLFLNLIGGLVTDRPFCPILLGHPSKSLNSEYSGSTAWENAVRMRWYLDDKLPDKAPDSELPPDPEYRVLSKRKTNYTRLDYIEFRFDKGVLLPANAETTEPGLMASLQKQKALRVIVAAAMRLTEMNLRMTEGTGSPHYLPKLAIQYKLNEGLSKTELAEALRAVMLSGTITKGIVGKYQNRAPMDGLICSSKLP